MKKTVLWLMVIFFLSTLMAEPVKKNEKTVKPVKPALVVIDTQNQFLPMMAKEDKDTALRMINTYIWLFRKYGFPVIRIYHTDLTYGPKEGSKGFQFPSSIKIKDTDAKIVKNHANAFNKTGLKKLLDKKGCNTLFLCGLSSVGCVLATFFGGVDLDYEVFLIKNALIGPKHKFTKSIEDIYDAVGFTAVETILKSAKK